MTYVLLGKHALKPQPPVAVVRLEVQQPASHWPSAAAARPASFLPAAQQLQVHW